ncbi:MAG TPA: LacI family DNA-binding transcriptional regulator [Chthoniobacterales bacterium]|nr:LacI family DNA-binding transcriptional regulator [Chthoniobacterales bacterium]
MRPSLKDRGTLTDVAKAVGVSVASVSYAFSRPDQLSPELRQKILATARSLNYPGPNPAARMLRTGFAGSIAVVYASPLYHVFQDPAASAFLSGVAEACSERHLGLLLLQCGDGYENILRRAAVDGLIIYTMPNDGRTIQTVVDRGLPMVVVDQFSLPNVPFVGIEERAAARACAQHLKDLGHKRFAIVTFPLHIDGYTGPIDRGRLRKAGFEVARRRMQGYLSVIESAGTKTSMKIWECLRSSEEDGRTAGEFFLENKPRPTAILATSDRLALGVMEFARTRRLRIPEDLAVVGFDDIPAARMSAPRLTTVHQSFEEKGRRAVAVLLKEKGPLKTILPTKLIIRQSSDPAVLGADQERALSSIRSTTLNQ